MAAQEDYESFAALAERMQLEEDEAENFINSAMKRLGYKAKQIWEDDDGGEGGKRGGDFFAPPRRTSPRQTRSTGPSSRRSSGGRWQYQD